MVEDAPRTDDYLVAHNSTWHGGSLRSAYNEQRRPKAAYTRQRDECQEGIPRNAQFTDSTGIGKRRRVPQRSRASWASQGTPAGLATKPAASSATDHEPKWYCTTPVLGQSPDTNLLALRSAAASETPGLRLASDTFQSIAPGGRPYFSAQR
jgi:hypothetical protein